MPDESTESPNNAARIAREAEDRDVSLLADFIDFIKHHKKWWLIPLLLSFALIGLLATVGGSALGPFIYPML